MKDNKKSLSTKRMYPRLFCVAIAILTAIAGASVKDWNGLIYLIWYTIMFFFINEANQKISDDYYQKEINKLSERLDKLENSNKGE